MKYRIAICMVTLSFIFSACSAASAAEQPGAVPPDPYADTPVPPVLDAPRIEAPALVNFHFINELDGWGATQTQIVRTNDGGSSWYNVTPPDVTEAGYGIRYFVLDPNHVWVQRPDFENYPNSGFLYRTSDGGLSWNKFETPFSAGDMQFVDDRNGWMLADLGVGAGSNAVAVYRTDDGGERWTLAFNNDPNQMLTDDSIPLGGLKTGLTPLNTQTAWVYGVTYAPGTVYLYRTDDGGKTWSIVSSVLLPESAANAEISIDQLEFLTPNDAMMAVRMTADESKLALYISKDAGNSWLLTPTFVPKGGSVDFLSVTDAVVYNGDQFYVTRDAAQTWNTTSPEIVFGDTFASMDFVNTSSGWVLTMDPTTQHSTLYRTTDGGSSWFPVIP